MCDCPKCRLEKMVGCDLNSDFGAQRGGSMVSAYMTQHGCGYPQALQEVGQIMQQEWDRLPGIYAARHGLDIQQAMAAIWMHASNSPSVLQ
jgi:hypothetical protein